MIRFEPVDYSQESWLAVAAGFPGYNLMQDWSYGAAKAAMGGWQVERGLIVDADKTIGAVQVLVKQLPVFGGGLAWVNRGPLGFSDTRMELSLRALHQYYVGTRGCYLRIAPLIDEADPLSQSAGEFGFHHTETKGWASATLDLSPDLDSLRSGLRQKWRNALNKAERAELTVETGSSETLFNHFVDEYERFLSDRGVETTVTPDLLQALQQYRPSDAKLTCFSARHDETPLGTVLIAQTGDSAEYLAGTLLDAGRAFNVGQLLLWRAIGHAKSRGVKWFDLGGMDPELTPKGIFEFKRGVGGTPYGLAPEIGSLGGGWRAALVRWRVARARAGSEP